MKKKYSKYDQQEITAYWLLRHYDFMTLSQQNKLIFPVYLPNTKIIYYIVDSELFGVLHEPHQIISHGGPDRKLK